MSAERSARPGATNPYPSQRLSLARLWLAPAPLWLLDEPYANLDLDGINLVNRMIQAHLREGGAALLTTHGAYAAPPARAAEHSMAEVHTWTLY